MRREPSTDRRIRCEQTTNHSFEHCHPERSRRICGCFFVASTCTTVGAPFMTQLHRGMGWKARLINNHSAIFSILSEAEGSAVAFFRQCHKNCARRTRYFRFIRDANLLSCRLKTLWGDTERRIRRRSALARCACAAPRRFARSARNCRVLRRSDGPLKRARGADVLAQLGKTADHPENNFPEESFDVVVALAESEKHIQPLSSAIQALGHIGDSRAVPLLVRHSTHPEAEIRFAVACASGSLPTTPPWLSRCSN